MADHPEPKPAAMTLLEIPGKTPEEIEATWYQQVYQGDQVPQLTLRAILTGSVIGVFMCLSNLYVGLKTGWALGVVVTASIISFAVFGRKMSILENNAMASTASSAGYSTGGTMVSATAAYLLLAKVHIEPLTLVLWTFFLSALGVFFAIPMKRQMVNIEQLKFPTGTAAAVTLRTLHSTGGGAHAKAWSLAIGGLVGAILAWVRDGFAAIKATARFAIPPGWEWSPALTKLTMTWDHSLLLVGAGAITGMRVGLSMLIGGLVCFGIVAPEMIERGVIVLAEGERFNPYRDIVRWSVWPGVAIMVSSSLLQFFMQGKTVLRAFKGLGGIFAFGRKAAGNGDDPLSRIEVPGSWFGMGLLAMSIGTIVTAYYGFGIPFHHGVIAILLSFVLCIVACRATGETDTTPVGALGKITQLTYGVLIPKNMTANLMTASITGNTAATAADLLTDLKAGYLLGANPRKQFLAQFIGCFVGTAIIVPAFYLLVPNAASLGTQQWPAPSAQTWASVALLLSDGFKALHPTARWGMVIGAAVGLALPIIEKLLPGKAARWVPSTMSLGLAFVIPFSNSLSMFVGALVAWLYEKANAKAAEAYVIPVASGVIAGESIVGVAVILVVSLMS